MWQIQTYHGRVAALLFLCACGWAFGCSSVDYLPKGGGEKICHTYYTIGYHAQHKQASWVYYELKERGGRKVSRKDNFRVDPKVKEGISTPEDYKRSGYDQGHLCPAADMSFDVRAMSETFYMSNMSPQEPAFNRGAWKRLEEQVRKRARKELLYVVTGPVFKNNKGYIGKNRVTVPGYYYKLFYAPVKQQMIAYVLPNQAISRSLSQYAVPVDKVEELTGLDFFSQLPDEVEQVLEADTNVHLARFATPEKEPRQPKPTQRWIAVVGVIVLFLLVQFLLHRFTAKWGKKRGRKHKKKR